MHPKRSINHAELIRCSTREVGQIVVVMVQKVSSITVTSSCSVAATSTISLFIMLLRPSYCIPASLSVSRAEGLGGQKTSVRRITCVSHVNSNDDFSSTTYRD